MVDYSKWKDIEISDDEDDTHPNIDTASLFRWRHQARIERMEEREREKRQIESKKQEVENKIKDLLKKKDENPENCGLEEELKKLQIEKKNLENRIQDIIIAEKKAPWNVDTISKEGWSKTVFNKPKPREDRSKLSDEELEQKYREHVEKYESKIKEYAMISKLDDAKNFLQQNPDLVCEETSNYLTVWCLNLEIEGKHQLMEYISRQVIALHYILELSKQLNVDPRACVGSFFSRIQQADKEYQDAFEDEIRSFRERIMKRAKQKIDEAIKECEEEEKQKRLGPGGLDPQEVFESLPEELQKCFESRDTELLQKTLLTMDPEQAKYHMKRCVDSGLWIPDKSVLEGNETAKDDADGGQKEDTKPESEQK